MTVRTQPKFSSVIQTKPYQDLMLSTLGDEKSKQRFQSSIMSAVSINPTLQECEVGSVLTAGLQGEALGLSPSPQMGHYFMVPFNVKGVKKAQFQMGYKGYIQLAIRSGQYKSINVLSVKEGEVYTYDRLQENFQMNEYIENDREREKANSIGYVGIFELVNGFKKTIFWTREKMEEHALKYSMGYKAKKGYTFWEKDFDSMAHKTVLRDMISKWGVMSIELQQAYMSDMGVINDDGTIDYVDNDKNTDRVNTDEVTEQDVGIDSENAIDIEI